MRARDVINAGACSLLLAACDPPAPVVAADGATPPVSGQTAPAAPPPAVPRPAVDILAALFSPADGALRYFAKAVDLNGDGRDEVVAEVVGDAVCGNGGCSVFVLSPDEAGLYKVIAQIGPADAPVHAAGSRSHGWRDLLVSVGGAGHGPVRLAYDGRRYPDNPTTAPAEALPAVPADAELLIAPYRSREQATSLPVPNLR